MNYLQKFKNRIKYIGRKYFGYDLSALKIKLDRDFLDQKEILSTGSVQIIFDVGANHAQTTHKYRKLFPRALIYGFEPAPEVFKKYREYTDGDKKVRTINAGLSNKTGTQEFFINQFYGAHSLLPSNEKYVNENNAFKNIQKIKIATETLDDYCKRNSIEKIDILKMDVQGGELLVLQGAQKMLTDGKINLIYTEIMFVEIYKNQPLFNDIKKILEKFGYVLHNTYNLYHGKNGELMGGDAIFMYD